MLSANALHLAARVYSDDFPSLCIFEFEFAFRDAAPIKRIHSPVSSRLLAGQFVSRWPSCRRVEMGYRKNSDRPFAWSSTALRYIDRVRLTVVLFAWMKAICRHRRFDAKSNLQRESGAGILIARNYFSIDPRHFYSTRRGKSIATREAREMLLKSGQTVQKVGTSHLFTLLRADRFIRARFRGATRLSRAARRIAYWKIPVFHWYPPSSLPPRSPRIFRPIVRYWCRGWMRENHPRTVAGAPCEFIAAESPTYERRLRFENRAKKKRASSPSVEWSIFDKPGTDGRRASLGFSPLSRALHLDLSFHGDVISEDRPLQLNLRDPRFPPLPASLVVGCSYWFRYLEYPALKIVFREGMYLSETVSRHCQCCSRPQMMLNELMDGIDFSIGGDNRAIVNLIITRSVVRSRNRERSRTVADGARSFEDFSPFMPRRSIDRVYLRGCELHSRAHECLVSWTIRDVTCNIVWPRRGGGGGGKRTQKLGISVFPRDTRKSCVPLLAPFHMPLPSFFLRLLLSCLSATWRMRARCRKIWGNRVIANPWNKSAKVKRGEAKRGEIFLALVFRVSTSRGFRRVSSIGGFSSDRFVV